MGLLRIILAVSVIAGHSETTVFGLTWVEKFYAVEAFFTISGFYMALVLNGKYNGLPVGAFYRARALRIYPSYFVGLALMIVVNRHDIGPLLATMSLPSKLFLYIQNAFIVGQDLSYVVCVSDKTGGCVRGMYATINPPAWSLAVELGFYLIAPVIVRHPRRIVAYIALGTLYLLLTNGITYPLTSVTPFNFESEYSLQYYFYPASFIFFGAGALAYHLRDLTIGWTYALVVATVIAFANIRTLMPPWHLMILALAIPELFRLTKASRVDRLIGEFSYPLYILHWPILTYVARHADAFAPLLRYATLGTLVTLLTGIAATVLFLAVDRPMDRIRRPPAEAPQVETSEPTWLKVLCGIYLALPFATLAAVVR